MIRPQELTSNRIYDNLAPHYGCDVDANVSARLKYDLALKYIGPEDDVLDVGCANGIHMRLLARKCRRITGVDISDAMLDSARKTLTSERISNADVERRSATDLGFTDASFNVVYSFATLTLVRDIDEALREISRVLCTGGYALLDIAGRWNLSHAYWRIYYRRHGHFGLRAFAYRQAVTRLEALGMQVIESHASGFLDQWRYIPGLHWCRWLDGVLHSSLQNDLDYRMSNSPLFFPLASRWYLVCRKAR